MNCQRNRPLHYRAYSTKIHNLYWHCLQNPPNKTHLYTQFSTEKFSNQSITWSSITSTTIPSRNPWYWHGWEFCSKLPPSSRLRNWLMKLLPNITCWMETSMSLKHYWNLIMPKISNPRKPKQYNKPQIHWCLSCTFSNCTKWWALLIGSLLQPL